MGRLQRVLRIAHRRLHHRNGHLLRDLVRVGPMSLEALRELPARPAPPTAAKPPSDPVFSVRDYLDVVASRKWALVTTFLIVAIVNTIATFSQTPVFRASTLVLIELRKPNVAN